MCLSEYDVSAFYASASRSDCENCMPEAVVNLIGQFILSRLASSLACVVFIKSCLTNLFYAKSLFTVRNRVVTDCHTC